MTYRFQPVLQGVSALLAFAGVAVLGFLVFGEVNWSIAAGVAVGTGVGVGLARSEQPSTDNATAAEVKPANEPKTDRTTKSADTEHSDIDEEARL